MAARRLGAEEEQGVVARGLEEGKEVEEDRLVEEVGGRGGGRRGGAELRMEGEVGT